MSKNIRTKTPYVFDGTAAEFMFGCSNFPTNNLLKPLRSWMATYNFAAKFFKKHHSGFYDSLRLPIMGNWVSKFLFLAPYDSSKDLHKLLKLKSAYQYKKIYYDVAKCLNKFQQDDVLNNIIYLDYRHHGWIFTAESEKSAMNAGVEMVSPYADRKLIEYFFTIQEKWKTNQVDTKYILRKIVAKYLGGDIAFRKSNTLVEFPLGNWIREELRGLFEQYLFIENEYIDTKFVKQIFSDHLQKRADYRLLLYQIFQFQYLINTFTKW
jgi:asparagine synthetase B (glutamine-hydrolysing)